MDRFDQIKTLIESSEESLSEIERLYKESLSKKEIDPKLLVKIKNFLENLRASLDYSAKEIFERYCSSSGKHINTYFPILKESSRNEDFESFMKGCFPGLCDSKNSIFLKLRNYQCFSNQTNENKILLQFKNICDENKHENLSPQTRIERNENRLTDSTGRIMGWNDDVIFGDNKIIFRGNGRLSFGPGGSLGFTPRGIKILDRPVNSYTQKPELAEGDKLEKLVWVDFVFSDTKISVLPFMKNILNITKKITKEMDDEIKK